VCSSDLDLTADHSGCTYDEYHINSCHLDRFPPNGGKKNWDIESILISTIAVPTLWGGIFGGIMGRSGID